MRKRGMIFRRVVESYRALLKKVVLENAENYINFLLGEKWKESGRVKVRLFVTDVDLRRFVNSEFRGLDKDKHRNLLLADGYLDKGQVEYWLVSFTWNDWKKLKGEYGEDYERFMEETIRSGKPPIGKLGGVARKRKFYDELVAGRKKDELERIFGVRRVDADWQANPPKIIIDYREEEDYDKIGDVIVRTVAKFDDYSIAVRVNKKNLKRAVDDLRRKGVL